MNLNNREYKRVAFFVPDEWVCFEMENGLAYVVLLGKKEIDVRIYAESILKFVDDVVPGNEIGEDELRKAEAILETAPLPQYTKKELNGMDEAVRYKLTEIMKK